VYSNTSIILNILILVIKKSLKYWKNKLKAKDKRQKDCGDTRLRLSKVAVEEHFISVGAAVVHGLREG